jgi:hypothetical protein
MILSRYRYRDSPSATVTHRYRTLSIVADRYRTLPIVADRYRILPLLALQTLPALH